MTIKTFRILVGAGVLAVGLAWVSQDRAIAGSGAAVARTVVGTAACDQTQFEPEIPGPRPETLHSGPTPGDPGPTPGIPTPEPGDAPVLCTFFPWMCK